MTVRETPWAPGTPCWVDLMTPDQAAAREFYAALFGWQIDVGRRRPGTTAWRRCAATASPASAG